MNARLHGNGVPYGGLKAFFRERLPDTVHDADQMAFDLVAKTLDSVFGPKATGGWYTFRYETGKMWVKAGRPTNSG